MSHGQAEIPKIDRDNSVMNQIIILSQTYTFYISYYMHILRRWELINDFALIIVYINIYIY